MSYTFKQFGDRSLFFFEDQKISYERMIEVIDVVLKPQEKTDDEITSWTMAYTFKKGDITIYFEHFYHPDYYFSFELYPLKIKHSEENILKLKSIIDQLDHFLYA